MFYCFIFSSRKKDTLDESSPYQPNPPCPELGPVFDDGVLPLLNVQSNLSFVACLQFPKFWKSVLIVAFGGSGGGVVGGGGVAWRNSNDRQLFE